MSCSRMGPLELQQTVDTDSGGAGPVSQRQSELAAVTSPCNCSSAPHSCVSAGLLFGTDPTVKLLLPSSSGAPQLVVRGEAAMAEGEGEGC